MAGFFGLFDYTKEGPGVDPDAPPKGAFASFFSILGRKFWKICTISIMYSIFSIPALVVAFFASNIIFSNMFPYLTFENLNKLWDTTQLAEGVTPEQLSAMLFLSLTLLITILITGLAYVVVGPTQAGATYLLRNYAREEHAFVWSDFREHAFKNIKQSLVVSFITLIAAVTIPIALRFYSVSISFDLARIALVTLLVIFAVVFSIMLMYVYQMMVTFQLTVRQLFKNAFLFSILRLPFNVLILIAQLIIIGVIPFMLMLFLGTLGGFIAVIYMVVFGYGANLLLVNFFINRQIQRFMIQPMLEREAETELVEAGADEEWEDWEEEAEDEEDEEALEDDPAALPSPRRSPAGA